MAATPHTEESPASVVLTPFECAALLIVSIVVCAQLGVWALSVWPMNDGKPEAGASIR